MPEKIRSILCVSHTLFVHRVKEYLKADQRQLVYFFVFIYCLKSVCFVICFCCFKKKYVTKNIVTNNFCSL